MLYCTPAGYLGPMLALWYMTGVSYSITSVSMGFLRPNITSNVVTLLCRNDTTNRYIANANFWVNSFTRVEDISYGNYTGINTSATIMLTPQDEGVYFCGVASQGIISSNDITLLGMCTIQYVNSAWHVHQHYAKYFVNRCTAAHILY